MTLERGVYLRAYLTPLAYWLERDDVTDILINRPGEIWFESQHKGLTRADAPDVTALMLQRLAQQIAATSHQGVNREHPLLAATLPNGARVQIVTPPATRTHIALAIRKHVVSDLSLKDYVATRAFEATRSSRSDDFAHDEKLKHLLAARRFDDFLRLAVHSGKNIVISGGTGTGKTTFLNALLKEAPADERLIVIEDTPEIQLTQANAVGLVAVKSELGESRVGINELLQAALRMRPDRLLVGEIRGVEGFTFLRAINTGHAGSMTTVHADSPAGAFEQIAFMALQAGVNLSRSDIIDYARQVVDVIVHLTRDRGKRVVSDIALGCEL